MIAEGGTEYGHSVTISRSKNIWGPYESNPVNPILTHADFKGEANPIQGVGHADLIQTNDGSWFLVALGFRPINNHQFLGRETFLVPVEWKKDEWPVVNGNGTISLEMTVDKLPGETVRVEDYNQNEEFNTEKLAFEWNYIGNPITKNYSLKERKGFLRLHGNEKSLSDVQGVTFVGRRQQHFDFNPIEDNEEAGITILKNPEHHYKLAIKKNGNERELVLSYNIGKINCVAKRVSLKEGLVTLNVSGTPEFYEFGFSQGNESLTTFGKVDTKYLSYETAGSMTGVYIGLFATGNGEKNKSAADFEDFIYKVK